MKIAGKCPPEPEELEATEGIGFENVELHLKPHHIDNYEESIRACRETDLNIVSIHTPHVPLTRSEYFWKSEEMAEELDAFLVVHSNKLHHSHTNKVENLGLQPAHGYENNPGASVRHLEAMILESDLNLVLDTAHLYMAEEHYYEKMEYLLDRYTDQIDIIHLCDSTKTDDGLGFGEGRIDMEKVCRMINDSDFDGVLVLEVMPEHQKKALKKWRRYTR